MGCRKRSIIVLDKALESMPSRPMESSMPKLLRRMFFL